MHSACVLAHIDVNFNTIGGIFMHKLSIKLSDVLFEINHHFIIMLQKTYFYKLPELASFSKHEKVVLSILEKYLQVAFNLHKTQVTTVK